VAKNTILKRAIEGDSRWSVVGDSLFESNMWFFVGNDLKVGGGGRREGERERWRERKEGWTRLGGAGRADEGGRGAGRKGGGEGEREGWREGEI
jgi:hypothetical protein